MRAESRRFICSLSRAASLRGPPPVEGSRPTSLMKEAREEPRQSSRRRPHNLGGRLLGRVEVSEKGQRMIVHERHHGRAGRFFPANVLPDGRLEQSPGRAWYI